MKNKRNDVTNRKSKARLTDKHCNICGERLNTWDVRLSKTLAYKTPVCEECIAKEYDESVESLRTRMERFFDIRPCVGI